MFLYVDLKFLYVYTKVYIYIYSVCVCVYVTVAYMWQSVIMLHVCMMNYHVICIYAHIRKTSLKFRAAYLYTCVYICELASVIII
jgi:hypothetical protein